MEPLIVLTGFGPFGAVEVNASELLVRSFQGEPPAGVELHGAVLDVDYRAVARQLSDLWAALPRPPAALVATGVHRGPALRLERCARRAADSPKEDRSGLVGAQAELDPSWPARRSTGLDLPALAAAMTAAGEVPAGVSDDAGGYLCERAFYLTLGAAERWGVPALFVHVPGVDRCSSAALRPGFLALFRALAPGGARAGEALGAAPRPRP
jgi:pyroglutamyl-peptidase